jgi:hypothetical protein
MLQIQFLFEHSKHPKIFNTMNISSGILKLYYSVIYRIYTYGLIEHTNFMIYKICSICNLNLPQTAYYLKNGKPHGAQCKKCINSKRQEKHAPFVKRITYPEAIAIKEKYKDDPIECKKQLNNLKAKRHMLKVKQRNISDGIKPICEKKCIGVLCKGKVLPIKNFCKNVCSADGYAYSCRTCRIYANNLKREDFKKINSDNTFKTCTKCDEEKVLTDFDLHVGYSFGRNDICKDCRHTIRSNTNYEKQTEGTRTCTICILEKDVSEFYKDHHSINGLHASCKKCHIASSVKTNNKYIPTLKRLISHTKSRAKKKGTIFKITYEMIDELFKLQHGLCAISGKPMTHIYEKRDEEIHTEYIMHPCNISIDRIDSNKPYVKSNIHLVCAIVNRIKFTLNPCELILLCTKICVNRFKLHDKTEIDLSYDMEKRLKQKFSYMIGNAKVRDIKVNISIKHIITLYTKQRGLCKITGIFMTCDKSDNDVSIDRIDSSKGYTVDNIQLVTEYVNKIKSDMSTETFLNWTSTIVKNNFYLSHYEIKVY